MYLPVYAIQDESCHWYLIPIESVNEFRKLSEEIIESDYSQDIIDDFENKFAHYRTGGSINNKQLYIKADNDNNI